MKRFALVCLTVTALAASARAQSVPDLIASSTAEEVTNAIATGAVNVRATYGGYAPLCTAAKHKRWDIVAILLRHGAISDGSCNTGAVAAETGSLEVLSRVPMTARQRAEALEVAVRQRLATAVRTLLRAGADPNYVYGRGSDLSVIAYDVTQKQPKGNAIYAVLNAVAAADRVDLLRTLTRDRSCAVYESTVTRAVRSLEALDVLLDCGMSVQRFALRHQDRAFWAGLIARGLDLNAQLVIEIVEHRRPDLVSLFAEHGVDFTTAEVRGRTPLMVAIGARNTPMLKLLLQHGANPGTRNSMGVAAIHVAAVHRWEAGLQLLREKAANAKTASGHTAGDISKLMTTLERNSTFRDTLHLQTTPSAPRPTTTQHTWTRAEAERHTQQVVLGWSPTGVLAFQMAPDEDIECDCDCDESPTTVAFVDAEDNRLLSTQYLDYDAAEDQVTGFTQLKTSLTKYAIAPASHRETRIRRSRQVGRTRVAGHVEVDNQPVVILPAIPRVTDGLSTGRTRVRLTDSSGDVVNEHVWEGATLGPNAPGCDYHGHYLSPDEASALFVLRCKYSQWQEGTRYIGARLTPREN